MRFLNRNENPNAIVGLFLLVLLAVFAGPTVLPQLISENVAFIDEGVPCTWLRQGDERASRQSLIGRAASSSPVDPPIRLSVRTGRLPTTPTGTFDVAVVITNETIGTIPIVVQDNVLVLDPSQPINGPGVVFNSNINVPASGEGVGTYPPERLHMLGPRQTCVHRVRVSLSQIPSASALAAPETATVKAFYRNNTQGTAAPQFGERSVYTDQGLWVGVVESPLLTLASTQR
ncbi:MAG: hypothetical protein OHK0046_27270 [Anaerolineae bacterium]